MKIYKITEGGKGNVLGKVKKLVKVCKLNKQKPGNEAIRIYLEEHKHE